MSTPLHTLAKVPSGGSLEDALADSLAGVPFNDVTFYAYTRRLPLGKVDRPRAVQANSRILKATSTYFRGLLSTAASTGSFLGMSAQAPAKSTDSYEYDCDSDLEDEDDDLEALGSLLATPSEISVDKNKETQSLEAASMKTKSSITTSDYVNTIRIVHLDAIAADTLEAIIFYLYTGNIYFLPLRSRGSKAREDAKALHDAEHSKRPMCSCKSVYRFAEEAGLDELKILAEAHLFEQLREENILEELFSKFSARYPDILRRQIDVLLTSHWTPSTRATLGPVVERVVRGELPHAAPVLTMLLGKIPPAPLQLPASWVPKSDAPAAAKGSGKAKGAEPTRTPSNFVMPPPPRMLSPDGGQSTVQGGDGVALTPRAGSSGEHSKADVRLQRLFGGTAAKKAAPTNVAKAAGPAAGAGLDLDAEKA